MTVYVGCEGGQLLEVAMDTASVHILANPHLSEVSSVIVR